MYFEELKATIASVRRLNLPDVAALIWRAFNENKISEVEAGILTELIEAKKQKAPGREEPAREGEPAQVATIGVVKRYGSRPRTDASLDRRRRWVVSAHIPPHLAARFTYGEQAVLALISSEVERRGDCRLAIEHIAALAGVCRTVVKNAIREARKLGLIWVEERRITGFRNDTNVVTIIAPEWIDWLRFRNRKSRFRSTERSDRRSAAKGGGVTLATCTHIPVLDSGKIGPTRTEKSCRGAAGDLNRGDRTRIDEGRGAGRVMR